MNLPFLRYNLSTCPAFASNHCQNWRRLYQFPEQPISEDVRGELCLPLSVFHRDRDALRWRECCKLGNVR